MKIVLTTDGIFSSSRLKEKIIQSIQGKNEKIQIDTWSYTKSSDNYDIIYHNASQYLEDPNKNVIFRVEINGDNLLFSCAWWANNPQPDNTMFCIHVGRLTEMLFTYFSQDFSKFMINDYKTV